MKLFTVERRTAEARWLNKEGGREPTWKPEHSEWVSRGHGRTTHSLPMWQLHLFRPLRSSAHHISPLTHVLSAIEREKLDVFICERFPTQDFWELNPLQLFPYAKVLVCIVVWIACFSCFNLISSFLLYISTGLENAAGKADGIDYDSENSDCQSVGSYSSGEFEHGENLKNLNLNERENGKTEEKSSLSQILTCYTLSVSLLTLLISWLVINLWNRVDNLKFHKIPV